ncbi:hypothetical protein ZIOFF_031227 [Zingiber officinale]|uniref:Phospholipase/carboxylesterase/thioesterase domain-containing protein n=1 Tax=Zingiber officinale TaxID=94328 RepID=A0A8J5GSP0_ZINOF|nr:hypothetical protein ZIOFF_031227 [Zingiber officinale]
MLGLRWARALYWAGPFWPNGPLPHQVDSHPIVSSICMTLTFCFRNMNWCSLRSDSLLYTESQRERRELFSAPGKSSAAESPVRPVAAFGGFSCTAWFNVWDIAQDGPDDTEGIDASAVHIANLLSSEPPDAKLGIGGFSMGAATALYSATCFAYGRFGNGALYPINLSSIVSLSGWLPCSRSLKSKMESSQEATRIAAFLPILICHGRGDGVVPYKQGEKSAEMLRMSGFRNLTFKAYNGVEHYTVPEEMDAVCKWLTARLRLDGSR